MCLNFPRLSFAWLTCLLELDDAEHPDPGFRNIRLTGESRGARIAPSNCRGIIAVHLDQIAGQPLLVSRIAIAVIADRHGSHSRSSSAMALAMSLCRLGSCPSGVAA